MVRQSIVRKPYFQDHANISGQGDEADAIYIVLNGRVCSVRSKDPESIQTTVTGEYGNGESVGELEVLTDVQRPSSLHAVRETELARFPKQLFQSLALEHPGYLIRDFRGISDSVGSPFRSHD